MDAAKGNLRSRDDRPLLAVPTEGLARALNQGGPMAIRLLGEALGESLVGPAREALPDGLDGASPGDFAYAINAGLARFGLGSIAFEQWGDALVARWSNAPETSGPLAELSAHALSHALKALFGLDVSSAIVAGAQGTLTVLLASEAACAFARGKPGASVAEIVANLHAEAAS